jgi:hypothetical protein
MAAGHAVSKTYAGIRTFQSQGGSVASVLVEEDGTHTPLRHVPGYSPTGLEWGYGGSGPSDTSLAILLDATGEAALLPRSAFRFPRANEHRPPSKGLGATPSTSASSGRSSPGSRRPASASAARRSTPAPAPGPGASSSGTRPASARAAQDAPPTTPATSRRWRSTPPTTPAPPRPDGPARPQDPAGRPFRREGLRPAHRAPRRPEQPCRLGAVHLQDRQPL